MQERRPWSLSRFGTALKMSSRRPRIYQNREILDMIKGPTDINLSK
jgi:hypothetical protein